MIIADIQTARLNEKTFDRHYVILNSMTFRFLINQIMKSKKSYLNSYESMIAWLFKLQQKTFLLLINNDVMFFQKIKWNFWNKILTKMICYVEC